ncbi:hypothetical protein HRG84_18125 [Flavisolibacter sp. BT320]|nr:hypothetical protein [Flavisolibacter longurius]
MEKPAGTGSCMYFIAVVLPQAIDEKVLRYKQQMRESYGCKVGLKSPAHVTIIPPYWMEEEKEAALMQDVVSFARDFPPFTLTTANFSAFIPRTIFVAVEENEMLISLKKNADAFFGGKNYKMKIESRRSPAHYHCHKGFVEKSFLGSLAAVWKRKLCRNRVHHRAFAPKAQRAKMGGDFYRAVCRYRSGCASAALNSSQRF